MALYDLTAEKLLLKEISDGNSLAFSKMFSLYRAKILSFVDSFVHSKADAEEIVQETFLVIWQNKEKLLAIEHPRNYIYTIARNKTYDYLAKISRNEKMVNNAWINTSISLNNIDEQINLKESTLLISRILQTLSVQKQEIFNMSRYQNMSHEEIAQTVGLSKSRVKNVIVEVLKHLKYHISRHNNILYFMLFWKFFL
ncbi:sigma-70 family RNA polymerase sigma factor [Pedobacter sp. ASV28]|jgi:RNA polymerase sigma-70 factor (family 1)|uniref:sigma-70 family RNA polymerase sigma factor n=1 Tax=Pedobacter sp. ASV28 TaxID=2795123 RepID=UPI0018EE15A5|nr:sigma-70 family RNA polymerase sigma factor [Pedobacter sp. ASV28]